MIAQATATVPKPVELQAGLSPEEMDRRMALAQRGGDCCARQMAFYLTDMAERGAHQALGFHSVELYAQARFHKQPRTTRLYLAVGRALLELPEIDRALCDGRLFWSQACELVKVATPATELEWIEAAATLSARQLATQVRIRRRGERPSDPARRRIHSAMFTAPGRLNAMQWATWNAARAKLEAELGRPVSDGELAEHLAGLLLKTRPDGSVPGRVPVNDSHYRVVMVRDAAAGTASVEIDGVPVEVDLETLSPEALAALDPNQGPPVPPEQRDGPVPPAMRRAVLARDGFACRLCSAHDNLTNHHIIWLIHGGRTEPENLATLCEGCHSLVHERLILILGSISKGLRFVDARGRDLRRPEHAADGAIELADVCQNRQVAPAVAPAGRRLPRTLSDLVGQQSVVANLGRAVRAARQRGEPAPPILLCGPTGLGKSSLAHAVAGEMAARCRVVHAPEIRASEQLDGHLAALRDGDVLFIDEIHRLPWRVVETLYKTMDAGRRFTIIGATTDEQLLPAPLRNRFVVCQDLAFYELDDLVEILRRAAAAQGMTLDERAAEVIARAARDTPRDALALLHSARDEAQLEGFDAIGADTARAVLDSLGIGRSGLKRIERQFLRVLDEAGGPVGLRTLADRLGKSRRAIQTVHEPFLVRRGLVRRTRAGRVLVHPSPEATGSSSPAA